MPPPYPKAVCAVIKNIDDPNQILVVSRKDDLTSFGLPGGKVDLGESLKEALCREIKEETGLNVNPISLIKVYETLCPRHAPEGNDYYAYSYLVNFYSGQVETQEAGVVKWGSWEDLEQGSFSKYNKGLKKALEERDLMLVIGSLVGMKENDAIGMITSNEMQFRITSRDGNFFPVTAETRNDRVNLDIADGKIISADIG